MTTPAKNVHLVSLIASLISLLIFFAATGCATRVGEVGAEHPLSGSGSLLKIIETKGPNWLVRDPQGAIVSLTLPREYAQDESLHVIGTIITLRDLKLYMRPNQPGLTQRGIELLGGLTNLSALRLWCGAELNAGVFQSITKLGNLRCLELVATDAPNKEYRSLEDMRNLEELRVEFAPNFGDTEICFLTNLVHMKRLTLEWDGISRGGTNILGRLTGLTNAVITLKAP